MESMSAYMWVQDELRAEKENARGQLIYIETRLEEIIVLWWCGSKD